LLHGQAKPQLPFSSHEVYLEWTPITPRGETDLYTGFFSLAKFSPPQQPRLDSLAQHNDALFNADPGWELFTDMDPYRLEIEANSNETDQNIFLCRLGKRLAWMWFAELLRLSTMLDTRSGVRGFHLMFLVRSTSTKIERILLLNWKKYNGFMNEPRINICVFSARARFALAKTSTAERSS